MNAAPKPIRQRDTMSIVGDVAVDASAENTPNHASPKRNARRRP